MRYKNKIEQPKVNIGVASLTYLENKYGEKFEYAYPWGMSYTGTHRFLTTCGSLPDQYVLVQADNFTQEDRVFSDNYLAEKYYSESIGFFHECALNVFSEAIIYYDVAKEGLSPDLPANASFEEFIADTRVFLVIMMEVKGSDFISEEQGVKVAELIDAAGPDFYLTIVGVSDDEYSTFDDETLSEHISLRKYVRCFKANNIDGSLEFYWLGED